MQVKARGLHVKVDAKARGLIPNHDDLMCTNESPEHQLPLAFGFPLDFLHNHYSLDALFILTEECGLPLAADCCL